MTEKNFANGLRFTTPSEKAPEWVKGQISVKLEDFIAWAQANVDERGWLNIDVKESKNGSLYCELNTYRRDKTGQNRTQVKTRQIKTPALQVEEPEEEVEEALPF
jgi:transglutaminase-like putative cysteine protease